MEKLDNFDLENLTLIGDEDGIVQVVLSRPAKRNALNAQTIEELIEVFSKLPRMGARAVVLRAEGDHFCAGLDLVEHHRFLHRPFFVHSIVIDRYSSRREVLGAKQSTHARRQFDRTQASTTIKSKTIA